MNGKAARKVRVAPSVWVLLSMMPFIAMLQTIGDNQLDFGRQPNDCVVAQTVHDKIAPNHDATARSRRCPRWPSQRTSTPLVTETKTRPTLGPQKFDIGRMRRLNMADAHSARGATMMRWSYVGRLGKDGALDWGGDDSGNIPASGHYLPDWEDTKLYRWIKGYAQEGAFEGRQIDWGAHAIKVNGPELLTILEEAYGSTKGIDPKTLLGRYAAFARKLGTEHYIALISAEM